VKIIAEGATLLKGFAAAEAPALVEALARSCRINLTLRKAL